MTIKYDDLIKNPYTDKERYETHYFLLKENCKKKADNNKGEYNWEEHLIYAPSAPKNGDERIEYKNAKGFDF